MTLKRISIGACALVLVLAGAVAFAVLRPGGSRNPPHSQVPASLQKQLDAAVSATVSATDAADWCAPAIYSSACTLHCSAAVFATDPRSPASVAQVRSAYAMVYCAIADPGQTGDSGANVMAIRLTNPPLIVEAPDDALESDLAKIFPSYAVSAAWWYYAHPDETQPR